MAWVRARVYHGFKHTTLQLAYTGVHQSDLFLKLPRDDLVVDISASRHRFSQGCPCGYRSNGSETAHSLHLSSQLRACVSAMAGAGQKSWPLPFWRFALLDLAGVNERFYTCRDVNSGVYHGHVMCLCGFCLSSCSLTSESNAGALAGDVLISFSATMSCAG